MEKELLKEKYRRFKQWQEKPYEYKLNSDAIHRCNNCGNEFQGNFCPICSQKAGMGRIGWRSVQQGIMDIWGLGTRSLLYSIWQLLWRPGHLISDYIDGKRQVSFPPVKMLFIVAVIYSMVVYWLLPQFFGLKVGEYDGEISKLFGEELSLWLKRNYSWVSLVYAVLAILPTWVMFRYAPRHTRHTLPEGFFIQIFLSVLIMVTSLLAIVLGGFNSEYITLINLLFFGFYYLAAYKQLFGYSFWGTLWRSGFILLFIGLIGWSVMFCFMDIDKYLKIVGVKQNITEGFPGLKPEYVKYLYSSICLIYAFFSFGIGAIINFIASRRARARYKQSIVRAD